MSSSRVPAGGAGALERGTQQQIVTTRYIGFRFWLVTPGRKGSLIQYEQVTSGHVA
jgi:hypothetical protein